MLPLKQHFAAETDKPEPRSTQMLALLPIVLYPIEKVKEKKDQKTSVKRRLPNNFLFLIKQNLKIMNIQSRGGKKVQYFDEPLKHYKRRYDKSKENKNKEKVAGKEFENALKVYSRKKGVTAVTEEFDDN